MAVVANPASHKYDVAKGMMTRSVFRQSWVFVIQWNPKVCQIYWTNFLSRELSHV